MCALIDCIVSMHRSMLSTDLSAVFSVFIIEDKTKCFELKENIKCPQNMHYPYFAVETLAKLEKIKEIESVVEF